MIGGGGGGGCHSLIHSVTSDYKVGRMGVLLHMMREIGLGGGGGGGGVTPHIEAYRYVPWPSF